jgi:hypothetical protein
LTAQWLLILGDLDESGDIGGMSKLPPAIRYGIDALLILVPLGAMTFFLFDPAAFNRDDRHCDKQPIGPWLET